MTKPDTAGPATTAVEGVHMSAATLPGRLEAEQEGAAQRLLSVLLRHATAAAGRPSPRPGLLHRRPEPCFQMPRSWSRVRPESAMTRTS